MSDMKQLLESVTRFAGEPEQKPGDQVRGTERAKPRKDGKHPFAGRLVGGGAAEGVAEEEEYCDACDRVKSKCICDNELKESLMQEYKYFVREQTPPGANTAPTSTSPVANINPAGTGTAVTQQPPTAQPGQQQPTQPGQAPTTAAPTAKPAGAAQTAQQPAQPGQPAKPVTGAPGAGTATPPNSQQVKQATDTVTKILNNPADPFNAQLQALVKKAGMVPR